MIVSIGKDVFLNLNSGLLVRFEGDQFARVITPCGYSIELRGDAACDLLWHLTDLALMCGKMDDALDQG